MKPIEIVFAVGLWASPAFACDYDRRVEAEARRRGISPAVAVAIMHAESSGNPLAVGPGEARGLFQFERRTWERVTRRPFAEAFDPDANIAVAFASWERLDSRDPKNLASWHNAGLREWRSLNPRWSVNHPNRLYRAIYRGEIQ